MHSALEQFLTLRRAAGIEPAADDSLGRKDLVEDPNVPPAVGDGERPPPTDSSVVRPDFDISESEPILAAYFMDLLAAHPSASAVKDRSRLANYLARGIMHRYGPPEQVHWLVATSLSQRKRERALWLAECPAGHRTDEAVESHQVLGWACGECQRVYDAVECRLVPRASGSGQDRGAAVRQR